MYSQKLSISKKTISEFSKNTNLIMVTNFTMRNEFVTNFTMRNEFVTNFTM
jgi:hypothetical protein